MVVNANAAVTSALDTVTCVIAGHVFFFFDSDVYPTNYVHEYRSSWLF